MRHSSPTGHRQFDVSAQSLRERKWARPAPVGLEQEEVIHAQHRKRVLGIFTGLAVAALSAFTAPAAQAAQSVNRRATGLIQLFR